MYRTAAFWIAIAVLVCSAQARAQTAPPQPGEPPAYEAPLTNDEIVKLAKAGLGSDAVVAKIKQAATEALDVSTDALIALRQKKVSSAVIAAMVERVAKDGARAETQAAERQKTEKDMEAQRLTVEKDVEARNSAAILDIPADRLAALNLNIGSHEFPMCSISGPDGPCRVEAFAFGEYKGDSTGGTCKKLDAATYEGHCVDGTLQGVVLVRAIGSEKRAREATLAYFSRGRITFPCLETFLDNTLMFAARTERSSYGCIVFGKWDSSDTREACPTLKAMFGTDVMNQSTARAIRDGRFDLKTYSDAFARWVGSQ